MVCLELYFMTLWTFSVVGIETFINILEGPSNGFEIINLFEEGLRVESSNGWMLLYGLSPQSFSVENQLRSMLRNVVELIFQSPYSPEFNSWEFRFRSMKAYLRLHKQFSKNLQ